MNDEEWPATSQFLILFITYLSQLDVAGDSPYILGTLATASAVMMVHDPKTGQPVPDMLALR